jgi:hypothetical protein
MGIIRITARELGQVLLDDFCERCFWFRKKFPLSQKHPFSSPLPGIVSQADAYIKRVMSTHLQQTGSLPSWLISELGISFSNLDFHRVQPITPERWEKDIAKGFCLVGEPDAIWEFPDRRWFIADYKMASLSQAQERLLPLYQTQLNAYAYLAEQLQKRHIAGLALVYFEPESSDQALADHDLFRRTQGQLILGFRCTVVPVEVKTADWLETLCGRVFEILSSPNPPKGRQGCQGCQAMAEWLTKIQSHFL